VTLSQVYENNREKAIETEYFFPANDLGVFHSFEAVYQDRTVRGVIKKKEEAKEEYDKGVKEGHMMAYAQIEEKTPDIMKILLGNLPAGEKVTIKLCYL